MKKILMSLSCIMLMTTSCQNENPIDEIVKQNILVYKYYTANEYDSDSITATSYIHTGAIDSIFDLGKEEFNNEVYDKTLLKSYRSDGTKNSKYEYKQEIGDSLIQLYIDTVSLSKDITNNINDYIQNQNTNNSNLNLKLVGIDNENYKIQTISTNTICEIYHIPEGRTYKYNIPGADCPFFQENLNIQKEIQTENGLSYICDEYSDGLDKNDSCDFEYSSTYYYKDNTLIQYNNKTKSSSGTKISKKELSANIKY